MADTATSARATTNVIPLTVHQESGGGLIDELRRTVRGEVRFDAGSRALYATDSSNYRQVPIGVVLPRDTEAIISTIAACRRFGAPVLARGGGTSLAGQCCNAAVVLDLSKYVNRIDWLDAERRLARVQPGIVLDTLRHAAEQHQLTFGPDPATHNRNTLGGMIGNNSCGVHSLMAGMTADNIEELEVLTYDGRRLTVGKASEDELDRIIAEGGVRGELYDKLRELRDRYADLIRARFPNIPRRVSGFNLPALLPENGFHVARALVGSEGTCATVLAATVRLVDSPPARVLVVLGYPDIYTACDRLPEILQHQPVGLEGFDDRLMRDIKEKHLHLADVALMPDAGGWLLVEFGGKDRDEATAAANRMIEALGQGESPPQTKLVGDAQQQAGVWRVREAALGAAARTDNGHEFWPGWEDSAVPPATLGAYLRELRRLLDRYGLDGAFYGHFGQGCLHTRIDFDLVTASGIAQFRAFMNDAADLVLRCGGSLSGEHGDGQARGELLEKMFGPELVQAFREFKAIWDPDGRMNPGKVINPLPLDQNLRLGTGYSPPDLKTHFQYPDDQHSFAHAALRCVGVGLCRREEGGTMCPSFMVTREEMHSTRGRARLLFEMLQGEVITEQWHDEQVKEALDLCLACKGCKSDCPVNVDMATYKAEFLSHYYAGRRRPLAAYSMGLIYWWARLASHAPGLANFFTQTPGLASLAKRAAGVSQRRRLPRFASQPFTRWFKQRPPRNAGKPAVILWPDTFNNYLLPHTARAAVEVLEAAGFRVVLPRQPLCCGRPLYDFGMLNLAEKLLRQVLDELRPAIIAGIPIVGLEPSCVAVFRDELINLFPNDEDARRLSRQTYLLSEFLDQKAPAFCPPPLARKAVVHGHCHHRAVIGMDAEERLLQRLGLDYELLDSGCCGMAGSFGFERAHYDVSIDVGERVLLPAVRGAAAETLVIADGFSCREQIEQTTPRRAQHLAEVLQLALHQDGAGGARS